MCSMMQWSNIWLQMLLKSTRRCSWNKIDRKLADYIAMGMKEWALSKGVTHYTHWFHHLQATAEKHDALKRPMMVVIQLRNLVVHNWFNKSQMHLVFQMENQKYIWSRVTLHGIQRLQRLFWNYLCIPTVLFLTPEVLDYKTPLLRVTGNGWCCYWSVNILIKRKESDCNPRLEEYFLIDRALANSRPDLMMTGRTLLGILRLKDNNGWSLFWFYSYSCLSYMRDLEQECMLLGIPVKHVTMK
jgi:glutamine synthetase